MFLAQRMTGGGGQEAEGQLSHLEQFIFDCWDPEQCGRNLGTMGVMVPSILSVHNLPTLQQKP